MGKEGRIHFYISNLSIPGFFKLTAGTGNVVNRTNCNEFIENIVTNHNFIMGKSQNIATIRTTVPTQFVNNFNHGLTL